VHVRVPGAGRDLQKPRQKIQAVQVTRQKRNQELQCSAEKTAAGREFAAEMKVRPRQKNERVQSRKFQRGAVKRERNRKREARETPECRDPET